MVSWRDSLCYSSCLHTPSRPSKGIRKVVVRSRMKANSECIDYHSLIIKQLAASMLTYIWCSNWSHVHTTYVNTQSMLSTFNCHYLLIGLSQKLVCPLLPLPPLCQVHLQTQQEVQRGLWSMATHVVKTQGVSGLYNGLTASLSRQVSETRNLEAGNTISCVLWSLTYSIYISE